MNIRLCLIGLVLFLPACQGPRAAGTALTYLGKNGFEELVEVYKYRAHDRQPAPAKLADLDIHEPALPSCYPKLQSGDYVVFWGVGLAAGSEAVLGYEKDVPKSGGLVMLQNGAVKTMSAAEFQAARKAGR